MVASNPPILTFTGGVLGGELHNRVDMQAYPTACAILENFRPRIQGPMTRRPPMLHVDGFDDHDEEGRLYSFLYSDAENYVVLHTATGFQFYAGDERITIPSVTASLAGSWTNASTSPSTISTSGGVLWLNANGSAKAIARKAITTSNVGTLHVLAFEVRHGPVNVRIGTTAGDDNLMEWNRLRSGVHYLAFTPDNATTYLEFWHDNNAGRAVTDNVTIKTATTSYLLPTPFSASAIQEADRQQIRDVLYLVHNDYWPRRLERRGQHSWSIVKLLPDDGPFGDTNTTTTTLTPSGTRGEITLTASTALFTSADVGVLYELNQGGQNKEASASADDTYTDGIKVTGLYAAGRSFSLEISGTFVGTVTLQRSSGNENDYTNWLTYTSPTSVSVYDGKDNETWYYRLAVLPGDYTSGTIDMRLTFQGGSTAGIVRVTKYTSSTSVTAEVLNDTALGSTSATRVWKRGAWNETDGFPSDIARGYGRLFIGRDSTVWASKSDDFTSFEAGTDADQSFSMTLASPSSDSIRWMAMVNHLVVGTSSNEMIGLANTNNEAIGPTNFQFLDGTEEGGARIRPVVVAGSVLYVHRSRKKLMQFTQNPKALSETSYISVDLTARAPEILNAEIVGMTAQREPERRIIVWLASGRMVELLFRREGELDVVAWSNAPTDGRVEDATVVPNDNQDTVYFITRRQLGDGSYVRGIEKYSAERIVAPDEYGHLDAAVRLALEKPDTVAEPSGTTGSITIETNDDAFVVGDVGARLWINGGRGLITAYTNARQVTVNLTTVLEDDTPADSGTWGFGQEMTAISGLDHLEGVEVRIYGDMKDLGTATVSGGEIDLPEACSIALVGRHVRSRWKSLKLAYGAQKGTALTMPKGIKGVGLLLHKCGPQLRYGPKFTSMWDVKTRDDSVAWGEPVPLFSGEKEIGFDGGFGPDPRLCLDVDGPAPATVAGLVPRMDERDR